MRRRAKHAFQKLPPQVTAMYRLHLDLRGHLTKVVLIESSGFAFFDNWGLEAVKKASPFPNPPHELARNGKITINWRFILRIR